MTRILLVHPFAQDISGPDRSILAVMRHLVDDDFHFDVALPGESPFAPEYKALGCRIFYFPMSIIKRRLDLPFLAGFVWRFIPTIQFLRRVIREVKPDLVHTNGAVIPGSGIAARLEGVPSVYHLRCSQIAHPRPVAAILTRIISATSQKVIAISQSCKAPMADHGYGEMTEIIHNGIDLEPFTDDLPTDLWRREYGLNAETPIVGQVGRMASIKGFLEFTQVCALVRREVKSAHFIAVGAPFLDEEREYEDQVRAEVERLGLNDCFHFAGRRDNIPEVMKGFDVFVTMVKEEGFGRVAVEAMAAGRPVVANRVDGLREVVRNEETGYLVDPLNPEDAAKRIVKLLQDQDLRERMGHTARQHAHKHFSSEECAQRTAAIYKEVLDNF